jgi:hypothetical protein
MVIGKTAKRRRTGSELNGGEPEEPGQDLPVQVEENQSVCRRVTGHEGFGKLRFPDFKTVGT